MTDTKRELKSQERGVTRTHTFFCLDKERHALWGGEQVVKAEPKTITVFGKLVQGWVVTTELTVIDKTITLKESLEGARALQDPE